MHLTQALAASEIQSFFFDWYPVFGVFFMCGLLLVFLKLLRGTMGTTKPETVKASQTKPVLWEEVQGVDAAKDELMDVAEWLRDPDRFAALGAQPPRGVLLYGPPGTGKTMLARAVAAQAGVDFFSASGSSFVEMFVGRGAARIRRLFKEARKSGRAVIFIDELDAVGGARSGGSGDGGTSEREQALNQLLVELDGFERDPGTVIVIAASNYVDKLDQRAVATRALRPPGAGRAAGPRRPRGDPARARQGQAARPRPRPHRRRPQDDRDDRRPARQRAQRGGDHRRAGGARRDRPRGPRRGAAAPVGRLPAGAATELEGAADRRLPRGGARPLPAAARPRPAGDPQHRPARAGARLRRPLAAGGHLPEVARRAARRDRHPAGRARRRGGGVRRVLLRARSTTWPGCTRSASRWSASSGWASRSTPTARRRSRCRPATTRSPTAPGATSTWRR